MSLDLILPFLRPLAPALQDPEVTDIMVNGSRGVFIERAGLLEPLVGVVLEERHIQVAAKHIARLVGDDVSEERPILDARLADGSRVAAVLPPASVGGTTLTIRKFSARHRTLDDLLTASMLTPETINVIGNALLNRKNVLISGGTGTGKTTLLTASLGLIPRSDRLVVIEDTAELAITHPNLVRLEARRAQADAPAVSVRDLVKAALRHRPDRIVIGEIRGGEAFDLLQALNTGHGGSLSTIHANSAEHARSRLRMCALMGGVEVPNDAMEQLVTSTIDIVVHLERRHGIRQVGHIA